MASIRKKFGQQTIGGGGGGTSVNVPQSHIFQIIGGNTIDYLGDVGIKHVTSTITSAVSGWSNGSPSNLPDGLGWGRSIDDGSFVLIKNDATSMIQYDIVRQPVFAVNTTNLSGANGLSYSVLTVIGVI